MHPQLSDKRISRSRLHFVRLLVDLVPLVCKDFIKALEECHATGWRRFTGACNRQKDELNRCLRTEVRSFCTAGCPNLTNSEPFLQRLARSARNRETAKERKIKAEQALKEFNDS
jgi:COX assembly protein 2